MFELGLRGVVTSTHHPSKPVTGEVPRAPQAAGFVTVATQHAGDLGVELEGH